MAQPSPPTTPPSRRANMTIPPMSTDGPFDIVQTYHTLLRADPELTMPVAAIEALVALLSATPSLSTLAETLALLNAAAARLKAAVPNPISLSAGTDLFTRYIVTTLRPDARPLPSTLSPSLGTSPHASIILPPAGGSDFHAVRAHLLANGRLFAARAKDARVAIARLAASFVRPGATVLTNGGSRVVGAVLAAAAESQTRQSGGPRFRVVWVTAGIGGIGTGQGATGEAEGAETIARLRAMQVPVAEISEGAVAYSMEAVTMALVGAEGVVETGGVISRLGTYQLATLAHRAGRRVYVVAESHKFVRLFPLGQFDLGVEQRVLDFRTGAAAASSPAAAGAGHDPSAAEEKTGAHTPTAAAEKALGTEDTGTATGYFRVALPSTAAPLVTPPDAVDYTPPELLTALVTEAGVLTPGAVSEELLKIWY